MQACLYIYIYIALASYRLAGNILTCAVARPSAARRGEMSFKELEVCGRVIVKVKGSDNLKLGEDVILRTSRTQKASLVTCSG